MNNLVETIKTILSIVKNVFAVIIAFISLFTTNTNSVSENGIQLQNSTSTQTALKDTKNIINTLNNIGDLVNEKPITKANKDKSVEQVQKINQLSITAPNHNTIDTKKKDNTKNNGSAVNKKDQNNTADNQIQLNISRIGNKDSVVNIRCENKINNTLKVITGSGVFISSSGLILTAAHVAAPVYSSQNDGKYSCYVRTGDTAQGNFPIKLIFIDKTWLNKYYDLFDKSYVETGENDIGILQVDANKLSQEQTKQLNNLSHSLISGNNPNVGDNISIISYPADIYGKFGVFTTLTKESEHNSIGSVSSFNYSINQSFDILETNPSSLGQSGASGGGIFDTNGNLIGIISNMIQSDILLKNKIRALTTDYINRDVNQSTGNSIYNYNK